MATGETSTNTNPTQRRGPSIHTLKSDTEETLTKRQSSVFSIAATVAKKRRTIAENQAPQNTQGKKSLLVFISILLALALGIGTYYYFTVIRMDEIPPEPNTPLSFIPTEGIAILRIAPDDQGGLLRSIELTREGQFPTQSLIYLPVRIDFSATSSAFLLGKEVPSLLSLDMPTDLSRTVKNQWGLYQMHNIGSVSSALLLSVDNPGRALAGLFAWEDTIADAFNPLFGVGENATTTAFRDALINNIDTRIISAPTTNLSYGIFGGNIVVIASDEKMLREILARLIAGPVRFSE